MAAPNKESSLGSPLGLKVKPLGQAGFRFEFEDTVVYVDPYLSDYVREVEGDRSTRLVEIAESPEDISDADWVLVTHAHIDHCDPKTLQPISRSSPKCKFLGTWEVQHYLEKWGISSNRVECARESWIELSDELQVMTIPAAHPTVDRDDEGRPRCAGYCMKYRGDVVYHSGDTSLTDEVVSALKAVGPIHTAFISLNERNYYRDRLGIVGNMSVREAFGLAVDIGVCQFVPMHWDMFAVNSVFEQEINLLYECLAPDFDLIINPIAI